jgi:hypothetical protein
MFSITARDAWGNVRRTPHDEVQPETSSRDQLCSYVSDEVSSCRPRDFASRLESRAQATVHWSRHEVVATA